jgi:hypothetical protein
VADRDPLFNAFESVEYRRDAQTMVRYPVLPEGPGLAHALHVGSTREGDPWRRFGSGPMLRFRALHVYKHGGPRAACGIRVRAVVPPEFNADDPDACPDCVTLVNNGQAWNRFRRPPDRFECQEFLRISADGRVRVYECQLRYRHAGWHRGAAGETWDRGVEDFDPGQTQD